MGCGCKGQTKERTQYENIKKMAMAFAKSENVTLCIYQSKEGYYSFIELDCPEFKEISPLEFISPLL